MNFWAKNRHDFDLKLPKSKHEMTIFEQFRRENSNEFQIFYLKKLSILAEKLILTIFKQLNTKKNYLIYQNSDFCPFKMLA